MRSDLDQGNEQTRLQVLTAPVDGVVQQLAVHTVGGVVTPAQALLVVAPSDSPLEVEAMVSNHDIGFVQAGQTCRDQGRYVQFHALWTAARQGGERLPGFHRQRQAPGQVARHVRRRRSSSEPPGQELSYAARISLDHTQMRVDDDLVNLIPGMAVTAEIKTGTRRIISYLFSPLLRYGHDSLRER